MEHAVILAGGSGTRLWPMSRHNRPKPLLPLVAGRSLLELTLQRLAEVFAPERTWIVTSAALADTIRLAAAGLPAENVIGEPAVRDTSNAIGLACLLLGENDAEATVGVFTADHVISPTGRFAEAVRDSLSLVGRCPETLVTFGVVPTCPHTGLGYIHRGESLGDPGLPGFHRVQRFVEKPDAASARTYLASGQYYWNSGMFVWRADTLIDRLERFHPEQVAGLRRAASAARQADAGGLARAYSALPKISIDYALMEPASADPGCRLVVCELDCTWLDLGAWSVLAEVNSTDPAGNLAVGRVVHLDSAGNILISDDPSHLLATVGLTDMVVVHSRGATLVAPKDRAQDVRRLLENVGAAFGDEYA